MNKAQKHRWYFAIFKIFLIYAAFVSIYDQIWLTLILVLITFILLGTPKFLGSKVKPTLPNAVEVSILVLIYISLIIQVFDAFTDSNFYFRIFTHLIASLIIGLLGFSLIFILNREKKSIINLSPLFASVFAFCFSITIGVFWQSFRYLMDYIFNIQIGTYYVSDAFGFLVVHILGAATVSFFGYLYLSGDDKYQIRKILREKLGISTENDPKEILKLIKKGESQDLEFKQTLRTNVHTNEHDKRIEISALKGLVAYMNSTGGILLIGVDDNGKIKGIEKDNFKSEDKAKLHFTNLLKKHIGTEFSSFIKFETIKIQNKVILKIDCIKSNRAVFLKNDGREEFYIRSGPSSIQLEGSKLLTYTKRRFRK